MAFPRFSDPCMKKLTVIGIMGNTQGVRIAASPAIKAIRKNTQRDAFSDSAPSADMADASDPPISVPRVVSALCMPVPAPASAFAPDRVKMNFSSVGGRHRSSSQHMYSRFPSRVKSPEKSTLILCLNTASLLNIIRSMSKLGSYLTSASETSSTSPSSW